MQEREKRSQKNIQDSITKRLYVGELSFTPAAGLDKVESRIWDRHLGARWNPAPLLLWIAWIEALGFYILKLSKIMKHGRICKLWIEVVGLSPLKPS